MGSAEIISLILAVGSAITAVGAVWFNWHQVKQNARSMDQKASIDLVNGLKDDNAALRGENRELRHELEAVQEKQRQRDKQMETFQRALDDCRNRRAGDDTERRKMREQLDLVQAKSIEDRKLLIKRIEELRQIVVALLQQLEENEIKPRIKPSTDMLNPIE